MDIKNTFGKFKGSFSKQKTLAVAIVVFVIVLFIRLFVLEVFFVSGDSMAPTILNGDLVFVNKLAYTKNEPTRGDIVVAIPRVYPGRVVKRIIGLPGEWFSIENERIVIRNSRTDAGVTIDESYLKFSATPAVGKTRTNIDSKEYFALGDNRGESIDSRELGMIDLWSIKGRVVGVLRFNPLKYIGF